MTAIGHVIDHVTEMILAVGMKIKTAVADTAAEAAAAAQALIVQAHLLQDVTRPLRLLLSPCVL